MLSDIVAHHIAQSIGIPPVTAQNRLLCEFRRIPARHTDLMPATVPK
jgi:hypothetical protein